jgi:hypothetical protein
MLLAAITKHALAMQNQKPFIKVQTGFPNREMATPLENQVPYLFSP